MRSSDRRTLHSRRSSNRRTQRQTDSSSRGGHGYWFLIGLNPCGSTFTNCVRYGFFSELGVRLVPLRQPIGLRYKLDLSDLCQNQGGRFEVRDENSYSYRVPHFFAAFFVRSSRISSAPSATRLTTRKNIKQFRRITAIIL